MRDRHLLAGLLALCCSAPAHAQVSDLVWRIEVDGTLSLSNPTASGIAFDGYTLACEAGCLDEANWVQLGASALADPGKAVATLGAGSLSFGPLGTPDPTRQLSEANLAASATLRAGGTWSFGKPIGGTFGQIIDWAANGCLTSAISGDGVVVRRPMFEVAGGGGAVCIPEPNSACLASMAGLGLFLGVRHWPFVSL